MISNYNLLTNADRNLILTGYTGPNQPRIGRQVAEKLGRPFVDAEARVEAFAGLPLNEIRLTFGEARLKMLEAEIMGEVSLYRGAVIRVNGGILVHSDHLERMAATGPVICLVATLDVILQRLHLTMGARYHDPAGRDLALGALRREWAVRGRDGVYEVDATHLTQAETIDAVIELWQSLSIERG